MEFARVYCDRVNARLAVVLPQSDQEPNEFIYNITLTLLPHQVLLLPTTYIEKLVDGEELLNLGLRLRSEKLLK